MNFKPQIILYDISCIVAPINSTSVSDSDVEDI